MLKTLFASKGFSQKALEGLADILVPNLTEESTTEELTAAITGLQPMTDIMQSEINRQVNDAKKPKPADPKPEPTPEPGKPAPAPEGETPEQKSLRLILEKLEKQDATIAAMQSEKVGNTRREQYAKALEGTSEAYKTKALKDFDRLSFKDDADFTDWLTESTEDAKVFVQEETNAGLGGERPAGGTGGAQAQSTKVAPAVAAFIAKQNAARKTVAGSESLQK